MELKDTAVSVLIVDDSSSFRQILSRVIADIPNAECVGMAATGKIALRKIQRSQPDLVLLDVMMPEMDGVETLHQIKLQFPDVDAIMISSYNMENAKATIRSLALGALDFVPKPNVASATEGFALLHQQLMPFIQMLQKKKQVRLSRARLAGVLEARHTETPTSENKFQQSLFSRELKSQQFKEKKTEILMPRRSILSTLGAKRVKLVLFGSSTGGPNALHQVFSSIKRPLPCPVIVVQHMPALFTESLAERLNKVCGMLVTEAKDQDILEPGRVYIAPGGKHTLLEKRRGNIYHLVTNDDPPVNNCKPAVDVLFRSVAQSFDEKVLTVIMTGMGKDGTEGVRLLRSQGFSIVQDELSSVVWGMPGSVYEEGLADEVLPLDQIGNRVMGIVSTGI
ncbi:chemotaxis response regulator protein-glutamate methylesterase [Deltaproteobacteria bacterium TL4]